MLTWRTAGAAVLLLWLAACRTTAAGPPAGEVAGVQRTLEALYASFCIDAGGAADWELMRSLLLEGAVFVAPIREGRPPRAVGTDEFLLEFRAWIADSDAGRSGFHERIVRARIDLFGHLAHAYVTFEGFVPPAGEAATRGVDSVQLVKHGGRWLVASFTTQYAGPDTPLPARFEP